MRLFRCAQADQWSLNIEIKESVAPKSRVVYPSFIGELPLNTYSKLADADNHTGSFSGATKYFSSLANAHHSGLVRMFHTCTKKIYTNVGTPG